MAKKAKAKKAPAKKAPARQSAKKKSAKKAARRAAPKPRPTKASKTKVAARAAATRNPKPAPKEGTLAKAAKVAAGFALLAVDGITKRLPWSKNENDPIELLKSDHRRFETLLKEGEESTERAKKGRREILKALTSELNVHEAIEEQILYPALEPHAAAHDVVMEGFQEHHVADMIVKELHDVATDDEQWGAKFKVLKENVEHHISEEENIMFPAARAALPKEELLALGAKMRALKTELEK
ncbi:MAG TPA: hemerythrin domain-containing protein [Vicinamibacterales bacterium]